MKVEIVLAFEATTEDNAAFQSEFASLVKVHMPYWINYMIKIKVERSTQEPTP